MYSSENDFLSICRICLKNKIEDYIPLESPLICSSENKENNTVKEILEMITAVEAEYDDNLPQNLCIDCTDKLKQAYEFVHLTRKSDEVLREELLIRSWDTVPDIEPELNIPEPTLTKDNPVAIIKKNGTIEYKMPIVEKIIDDIPSTRQRTPVIIVCTLCGKSLSSRFSFSRHMSTIHGKESFSCTYCSKEFRSKRYLKNHLNLHKNRERTFQCGTCPKSFFSQTHLIIHNESHLNVTYSCDICGKSFYRKEGLKYHMRKHLGETVKCDVCSKQFSTANDLKVHMRFHDNEFPYKCDLCPEKFVIKGKYTYHRKQHNKEKFKCSICSLEISLASAYRRHVFTHTGKPFPCPVDRCESSFTVRSLLSVHMRSRHDRELSMEELKFINTNFQVKLRSLSLPLNFDMNVDEKKTGQT